MLKLVLGLFLVTSSAFAGANGYDLKFDLSLNGKHISSPRMYVLEGAVASIEQKNSTDSSYIEVKATETMVSNKKRIKMNFTVGVVDKFGQKTVISKQNVIAKENELVKITLNENEDNSKHLALSVVAKRKSL
jgi:C4-type Zn-finger protein